MRHFLWSRLYSTRHDDLVSWVVCCQSKKEGGFGLGNLVSTNVALAGKWLWHFPLEPHSLRHQVIQNKYGLEQIGWDANVVT